MSEKTLKQIAEELNIPKQRLYRFVTSNHITESHQEGKTKWYDEAAQERIKAHFINNEPHQQSASDSYQYDAIIKTLTEQLQAKDEQIRQLQKLLDQEQQLRMVSEGRMLTVSESDRETKRWWQFWK